MAGRAEFPTLLTILADDSKTIADHHVALVAIRKSVSVTEGIEQILDELLALDPYDSLRKFLRKEGVENHCLTFEACWIVTNIASSTSAHCETIIAADLHTELCTLLSHPHIETVEQATWALGNIAGDSPRLRNLILEKNIVTSLCQNFVRGDATKTFRENVAWTLSNLCRGKPRPQREFTQPMLQLFTTILAAADKIMAIETEQKWIVDVLWAISYISDGNDEDIQMCLNHGLVPLVLKLFRHKFESPPGLADTPVIPRRMPCEQLGDVLEYLPRKDLIRLATLNRDVFETSICDNATLFNTLRQQFALSVVGLRTPAIRFFGNVVSGNDRQTDLAIREGVLDLLEALIELGNVKKSEMREILWSLSNIVAGTENQIRTVLGRSTLLKAISDGLKSGDHPVVKEATWVVSNVHSALPTALFAQVEILVIPTLVVRFTSNPSSPHYSVLNDFFETYENYAAQENDVWGSAIPFTKETDVVKLRDSICHLISEAKRNNRGKQSELVVALTKLYQLFMADCKALKQIASPEDIMDVLFFHFGGSQTSENAVQGDGDDSDGEPEEVSDEESEEVEEDWVDEDEEEDEEIDE